MNPAWPIKIPRYFIDVARWPANSTLPRECNINRNRAAARVKTFIGVDQPRSSLHLYYSGSLYDILILPRRRNFRRKNQQVYPPPPLSNVREPRFEGGISRIELYLECTITKLPKIRFQCSVRIVLFAIICNGKDERNSVHR